VLVVVNLDTSAAREGLLRLDLPVLGLEWASRYEVDDELTGESFVWEGPEPYVRLEPARGREAHILSLRATG
jgi:starch synthase (maltosyl-transferring)